MSRRIRSMGPKAWLACGFAVWLVALGGVRASTTPMAGAAEPAKKTPIVMNTAQNSAQTTATYVGEDTCLTCHDGQQKGYEGSPHHEASDPRSPAAKQGCESCHGPGSEHITDPASKPMRRFNKITPDEVNATCTTCHSRGEHALWDGSQHESRGLSCTTCHSIHSPESEKGHLKAKTQMELCATCHRDKVAKLDRSGHMPVREGKMQCTSCHNPHGTTNVKLLKTGDSVAELCTSCHADKRGPFLWEHAPSRDGCVTCHDPHGSTNERMLVAKPPFLCQRCHIASRHPAAVYDGAQVNTSLRVYGRSCVTCHMAIHGSNHPSGQRFIR
jgi:DmsE family decaheme c-type cytochrome